MRNHNQLLKQAREVVSLSSYLRAVEGATRGFDGAELADAIADLDLKELAEPLKAAAAARMPPEAVRAHAEFLRDSLIKDWVELVGDSREVSEVLIPSGAGEMWTEIVGSIAASSFLDVIDLTELWMESARELRLALSEEFAITKGEQIAPPPAARSRGMTA